MCIEYHLTLGFKIKLLFLFVIILIPYSCKENMISDAEPISSPAINVVINELFKIDSQKYYAHWWIEIYNPLKNDVDISNWKIRLVNSNFEIKFSEQSTLKILNSGSFIIITNNKSVFDDYWNIAPLTTLLEFSKTFPLIKESDEIQLIDSNDNIISVLRFGNYTPPGLDLFPNNKSFGIVDEFHSICRYSDPKGAFDTGNSINDFFEEPNPIAGYYSQRMKY